MMIQTIVEIELPYHYQFTLCYRYKWNVWLDPASLSLPCGSLAQLSIVLAVVVIRQTGEWISRCWTTVKIKKGDGDSLAEVVVEANSIRVIVGYISLGKTESHTLQHLTTNRNGSIHEDSERSSSV